MFGFKMNYQIDLVVKDDAKENAVIFANFIKQAIGLHLTENETHYNTDKIVFSMNCDIKDSMENIQKIQILILLLNKKMKENNHGDPKISGKFLGNPIFEMDFERIGLSNMMDNETKKDFNIIVRDNIFFKPSEYEPLFSNVLSMLKEKESSI